MLIVSGGAQIEQIFWPLDGTRELAARGIKRNGLTHAVHAIHSVDSMVSHVPTVLIIYLRISICVKCADVQYQFPIHGTRRIHLHSFHTPYATMYAKTDCWQYLRTLLPVC